MTAPVYTTTWATPRNNAPWATKKTARMTIVMARKIAEYTALGAAITPSAPSTAMTPSTQNVTASHVGVRDNPSAASAAT